MNSLCLKHSDDLHWQTNQVQQFPGQSVKRILSKGLHACLYHTEQHIQSNLGGLQYLGKRAYT